MIRIMSVVGDVLIEDRARGYMQPAQLGMTFTDTVDLLIATTNTSQATIDVRGTQVKLGPSSYLRLRPTGRSWWARHGLAYGGDARRWIGSIWAAVGGPTGDTPPPGANVVIGVRG